MPKWLTVAGLAGVYRLSEVEIDELLEKYGVKTPNILDAPAAAFEQRYAKRTDHGIRWHWFRVDQMIFRRQKKVKEKAVLLFKLGTAGAFEEFVAVRRLLPSDELPYIATRVSRATQIDRKTVEAAIQAESFDEFLTAVEVLEKGK